MSKPLTFTLKEKLTHRLDLSDLIPNELGNKSLAKIKKIKIYVGKKRIDVEKIFDLDGTDTQNIIFKKANDLFDSVGRNMTQGSIEVRGSVGDRLGQDMNGGTILVKGNADDWVGTGMRKGNITIQKNARKFLGGALPGQSHGLRGGQIHVCGDVADRAGDKMRRGMIVIEGNTGDYAGSKMIAGTIMICGQTGKNVGFAMKRGTIILNAVPEGIPATFNDCGTFELAFLKLIFNSLANSSRRLKELKTYSSWATRYAGDLGIDGKGELLILE